MKKISTKDKVFLSIIGFLILVIIGGSYAWLRTTLKGEKKVSIAGSKLELILDETNEGLQIEEKAVPMKDEMGKEGEAYTFTLENKGNRKIDYEIYLDTDTEALSSCTKCEELEDGDDSCIECEELEEKDIRYELSINKLPIIETLDKSRLLDKGTINGTEKINYELKIWLNYEAGNDAQEKVFYGKIRVEGIQNTEEYENGIPNEPVLAENMIPVVYNGYNWVKADTKSRWYDYERQIWANAVTVTNETRSTYQSAEAGTKINMNDILMMYVWIPRYSYTIEQPYGKRGESASNPGEIDVKFITTRTRDKGTAQYNKNEKVTEWYTPPGFTFGNKELSGVWIGKFETGSVNGTSPGDVEPETSKNLVVIKPNITSWRSIRVSTLEEISMGITEAGNIYGFDQTTYDAHAAKNTEWALISYLTQSKYGKYGNSLYTGENKQVYMNNYNKYQTGCSSGKGTASSAGSCAYRYDDLTSQGEGTGYAGAGASSTGNIYGIYDVNGGAWEYVMGNLADPDKRSGNTQEYNSGYTGKLTDGSTITGRDWKDDKYYDFYSTTSTSTACVVDGNKNSPCKGHALNEVAGWYGDYASMMSASGPWIMRGGSYDHGTYAGVFYFGGNAGQVNSHDSFRQVLTPNI